MSGNDLKSFEAIEIENLFSDIRRPRLVEQGSARVRGYNLDF